MSVIVIKSETNEYKILVKVGDEALARKDAVKAAISAEAARLSAIAADESEQVAIEKAAETIQLAQAVVALKNLAESAASASEGFATDSGNFATASNAAKLLSEQAKVIAIQEAGKSGTSAGQSAGSAAAALVSKNQSEASNLLSKDSEITATQQAGISTTKAGESNESAIQSGQSAAQSLASRNEAAAILANTLTGGASEGQIPFWNGPKNLIGDSGFVWDNVNKRLGLGVVPTESLDIGGRLRLRTVENGTGSILRRSATGVIQERTPTETRGDIGAVGGTGASGQIAFWNGPNTITSNANFTYNGSQLLINDLSGIGVLFRHSGTSTLFTGNIGLSIRSNGAGLSSTLNFSNAVDASYSVTLLGTSLAFGPGNTERWRFTESGIFQSNGAQTIQASGGQLLTLQSSGGQLRHAGNIPNGLGNIANYSATGVLQQRTPLQHLDDILTSLPTYNAAIFQTLTHDASGVIAWT